MIIMSKLFDSFDETPDGSGKKEKKAKPRASAARLFAPVSQLVKNPKFAVAKPPCCLVFDPGFVYWAGRNLPVTEVLKHLLILGASGAAKTKTIQLFLQSILPFVRANSNTPKQIIITDPKCEIVPYLAALGFNPEDEDVFLLHPFDARSVQLVISLLVKEPALARYFAALLITEDKNSTAPYFTNAARDLAFAAIIGMNAASPDEPWSLRDLLCALSSRASIEAVTNNDPRASEIAQSILSDEKHSAGVISTLSTKLGRYEEVAALMASNPTTKTFSVQEFLKKPGLLILGNDPVLKESLKPIVALVLKTLTDEMLRQTDTLENRQFVILDEFRSHGKLECIHDLLNMGRSKGVSAMIGIQSVEGVVELYQQAATDDLLSQCAHKTFLRAGGPQTAEWAEKHFGKIRHMEQVVSESKSGNDTSWSVQYSLRERSLFLASTFLDLPFAKVGGVYRAICDVPAHSCVYIVERAFDEFLSWVVKPASDVPALDKRSNLKDQALKPWSAQEKFRFYARKPDALKSKAPYLPQRPRRKPPEPPTQGDLFPPKN